MTAETKSMDGKCVCGGKCVHVWSAPHVCCVCIQFWYGKFLVVVMWCCIIYNTPCTDNTDDTCHYRLWCAIIHAYMCIWTCLSMYHWDAAVCGYSVCHGRICFPSYQLTLTVNCYFTFNKGRANLFLYHQGSLKLQPITQPFGNNTLFYLTWHIEKWPIHRWSSCYFFQIEFLTNVICTKNQSD